MAREVMHFRTRSRACSRREITSLLNSGLEVYEAEVAVKYARMVANKESKTFKLATRILDVLKIDDSNAEIERTFNVCCRLGCDTQMLP